MKKVIIVVIAIFCAKILSAQNTFYVFNDLKKNTFSSSQNYSELFSSARMIKNRENLPDKISFSFPYKKEGKEGHIQINTGIFIVGTILLIGGGFSIGYGLYNYDNDNDKNKFEYSVLGGAISAGISLPLIALSFRRK